MTRINRGACWKAWSDSHQRPVVSMFRTRTTFPCRYGSALSPRSENQGRLLPMTQAGASCYQLDKPNGTNELENRDTVPLRRYHGLERKLFSWVIIIHYRFDVWQCRRRMWGIVSCVHLKPVGGGKKCAARAQPQMYYMLN